MSVSWYNVFVSKVRTQRSAADLAGFSRTWIGVLAVMVVLFVWFATDASAYGGEFRTGGWWWGLRIYHGTVAVAAGNRTGADLAAWTNGDGGWLSFIAPLSPGSLGIRSHDGTLSAALPFWLIELALCAWTAPGVYQLLRTKEEWDGAHCLTCGYDLQASPERCPECGSPNTWRAEPKPPPPAPFFARLAKFSETAEWVRQRRAKNARRGDTRGAG